MNLEKKVLSQFIKSAKVLTGKNALSVLNTVAIRINSDVMHMRVNQLETWLTASIPFVKEESFSIVNETTLSERLYMVEAVVAAASVKRGKLCEIEVIDDFLHINGVKVPSSAIAVDMFPDTEFPTEEVEFMGRIKKYDNLIEAQKYVSEDETRYFMNGVYFEIKDDGVTLVSTDGRVLYKSDPSFATVEAINGSIGDETGYILRNFSKHFHLRLERFQCGKKGMLFSDDIFKLFVTYIEGQFPNYNRVIPDPANYKRWVFDLEEFKALQEKLLIQAKMFGLKRLGKLRIVMTDYESYLAHADKDKVFQPIGEKVQFENSLPGGQYLSFNMSYLGMLLDTDQHAEFHIHRETPESKAVWVRDYTRESLKIVMPMLVRD